MNEKKQQQQQQAFPFKLYEMLEYARASGVSSSISWLADGNGFVIHNKDAMMNDLTPMFFNQTKFRSFVSVLILTAVAVEVTQCLLLHSISTLLDLAALSHHYVSSSSHNLPLPLKLAHTTSPAHLDATAESLGLPSKRRQLETQGLPP
eukprot:scaffold5632_cov146-Skeletonema_marinoi.AAC.7